MNREQLMKLDLNEIEKYINDLESEIKQTKKYGLIRDKENTFESVSNELIKNIPILGSCEDLCIFSKTANNNNILIDGDNFYALSSLNLIDSFKVDFIYIDPPYNTGKQFKYNDSFVDKNDGYRHSKWLNFMSKRLNLARNLLLENGIIAISIDDNEQSNLKLLCDSIFGENNFLGNLIWKSKSGGANDSSAFGIDHEYILCYAKNIANAHLNNDFGGVVTTSYNKEDEHGRYALDRLDKQSLGYQASLDFPIIGPDGKEYVVQHKDPKHKKARWRWSVETVKEKYDELVFIYPYVYTKNYEKKNGIKPRSILFDERFGRTRTGSTDLEKVIGKNDFPYPKPVSLIKYLISICCSTNGTILDFFAGSGTTGQAVLELNKEDGGNRRFILCTNNENNICSDICYPRLKTVITGIKPDGSKYSDGNPSNLIYFKTDFVRNEKNRDQAKYSLVEKCNGLLCILEDCYDLVEARQSWFEYSCRKKCLFIYNDFYSTDSFNAMKSKIREVNKPSVLYVFSTDENLDFVDMTGIENVTIKPIPTKIYEIYKEIVENIKRGE